MGKKRAKEALAPSTRYVQRVATVAGLAIKVVLMMAAVATA